MSSTRNSILIRFGIIFCFIVVLFGLVIYRIAVIQYVEHDQWMEVSRKTIISNEEAVEPNRGNIFSADGRLLASTIPSYYIIMDTRVPNLHGSHDTVFFDNVDSLAVCLSQKFNDRSVSGYRSMLLNAYKLGDGRLSLYPKRVSYFDMKEVKSFPILRLGAIKGGLIVEEKQHREKPFGSLASRTIGDTYGERTPSGIYGRYGLERQYDSLLQGKPGIASVQKIANKRIKINKVDPIDGCDLTTTIDVDMQDIAEKSLLDMMCKIDAEQGCVILMEVKTGEIKACVNMKRREENLYSEDLNMAFGDMSEPGSTFKTMSLMAALDDGVIDITDTIDTYNGVFPFYGREMRDHNYKHGGYGKITVAQALAYSSNIGVSRIIMDHYGKMPENFVEKLYKMGLNKPMNLEIPGSAIPHIRHPKDQSHNWSPIDLAWMSIGYVVQMPPIYTLAFYNAIANDGTYIRPFFVKNIMKNGDVQKTFSTEVIQSKICSASTLSKVRTMLKGTVDYGTGSMMRSDYVEIAGKTGTAQLNYGKGERITHQVSFCGYFPASKPQYSAIVVIREPRRGYPSGGAMSGMVFKNIAEQIYARKVCVSPCEWMESKHLTQKLPIVKRGNAKEAKFVLSELDIACEMPESELQWMRCVTTVDKINMQPVDINSRQVPDVVGMGAKDAVYLMERVGLAVRISGYGTVRNQSVEAGTIPKKGDKVFLELK